MPRPRARQRPDGSIPLGFVSYVRVSTDKQGKSRLGLEAQRESVARYILGVNGALIVEFEEVESGKKHDRPQLELALAASRSRGATLIIAKLDRLARDTELLLRLVRGAGIGGIVFCDFPIIPPGPAGQFMLTLLAAVAEFEAGLISERTRSAMAALKARGTWISKAGNVCTGFGNPRAKRGDPNSTHDILRAARAERTNNAKRYITDLLPVIADIRKAGCVTLPQICAALTARGIRTAAGGDEWFPSQVWRIERGPRARP